MKALYQKKAWIKGILGIAVIFMVFSLNAFTSEAAQGTVIAETANIRAEANTTSTVVASTVKGKVIDIVEAVQDSSGVKWYKVPIANGGYGYIRSDLVETKETIAVSESSTQSVQQPPATVPTSIGEQQAVISVKSAVIRSGASKEHASLGSLPEGTAITLIGEANDSSGNKWYQMTSNYNGRSIEGYVRSDLITIGAASAGNGGDAGTSTDPAADTGGEDENTEGQEGESMEGGESAGEGEGGAPEEQAPEDPAPVQSGYNDYAVSYNDGQYWLLDYINGNQRPIANLISVADENPTLQSQARNMKIVIIILAVVVVLLVIVVTILIFKLKDSYYYEEYDEEEEEEIDEEEPIVPKKKKKRTEEEEEIYQEPAPVKKKAVKEPELVAAEKKQPSKKSAQRKSQNFLVDDDDEFEFEFLNMEDKEL